MEAKLGVNVDHVATLREARGTEYPEPVHAAELAERAGADQVTVHLRLDRRHIQTRDLRLLRELVQTRLNLEMSATDEMLEIARQIEPDMITLVPERREERTTEGGLAVEEHRSGISEFIERLDATGAVVSLFIDPDPRVIDAADGVGADFVELHTGDYADAAAEFSNRRRRPEDRPRRSEELERLRRAASRAREKGFEVAAGHGLDYRNIGGAASIDEIREFNIGHSIVSRSVFVGFERAVAEMDERIREARG